MCVYSYLHEDNLINHAIKTVLESLLGCTSVFFVEFKPFPTHKLCNDFLYVKVETN
jgi:hypothetical protein